MARVVEKDDIRRNPLAVWVAKGMQFARDHKGMMLGALAALILTVAGWSAYVWYAAQQERQAESLLTKAQVALLGPTADGPKNPEEAKKLFTEVASTYPRTAAAEEALIRLGNLQFDGSKYDEAIAAFERYLTTYPRGRFVVMSGVGKAYAEQGKGDLAAAERTLVKVIDSAKDDPLIGEAYTTLAQVYEAMKKPEDALRVYSQIAERFSQTRWGQNALQRMSALKSK
jgi:TolA-binding protein